MQLYHKTEAGKKFSRQFWFTVLIICCVGLLAFFIYTYTSSEVDRITKKLYGAKQNVEQTHVVYVEEKKKREQNIVTIQETCTKQVAYEKQLIAEKETLRKKAVVAMEAVYAELVIEMGGAMSSNVDFPNIKIENPARKYIAENKDGLFAWVSENIGRPYLLGAKGGDEGFDCSGLFASFGYWRGIVTKNDVIYNLSAQHIYDLGNSVSMHLLEPGDFIFWTKPGKNYKEHIALVVQPLQSGQIVVFDAAPGVGVSQRVVSVKFENGEYSTIRNNNNYSVVGGTNAFLEMEMRKHLSKEELGNQ